jgi:hypothetical protein
LLSYRYFCVMFRIRPNLVYWQCILVLGFVTYSCAMLRIHNNLVIQCTLRFGFVDLSLSHISVQPGLVLVLYCISSPCSLIYFRSVLAVCALDVHFITLFPCYISELSQQYLPWTCISYLVPCYVSDLSWRYCVSDMHFFTLFLTVF